MSAVTPSVLTVSGPERGDDIVTTFLGGCVGLIVLGSLGVLLLSFLFGSCG